MYIPSFQDVALSIMEFKFLPFFWGKNWGLRGRDMTWYQSFGFSGLYRYKPCDFPVLWFLWRCPQELGRFLIRDLNHSWVGRREEEGGPAHQGTSDPGVGVGALTWVKLRRTRTGGHWERKTDRWERRGEKRGVCALRGSLCCSLVSGRQIEAGGRKGQRAS